MDILLALERAEEATALEQALKDQGCRVLAVARDGAEACRLACRHEPDLALMDLDLPRMDGLNAAAEINRHRPTPVVLLFERARPELAETAARAGALSCLPKPLGHRLLGTSLRLALANFRQIRELADKADEMQEALSNRKLVERAKGALMDRLGLNEAEALSRLGEEALRRGLNLPQAAQALLDTDRKARELPHRR